MTLGKVLITAASVKGHAPALQALRDAGCELVVANTPQPCTLEWQLEQVQDIAALVFAMEPMPAQLLEAAPRLRVIARPGVGYDTVDLAAATRHKVAVTVAAGTNDQSVADHAFGLLLMASRGLLTAVNSVQAHGWDRPTGTEAWRKTLAIVGYGRIGRAIARRARGFDMRVLVVTPRPDPADKEVEFVSLDEALTQADFVSLSAPLTPQTEGLINASTLAQMKKGAFLINTSRGGLIDEAALAEAVMSGHLGGAAVDVLRQQGANSPSPLIGVPGILVTPHMATLTRESMARVAMSVAAGVIAVLRGERAANTVNPEVYDGH